MNNETFKNELFITLTALHSIYLGSRDAKLSDFISSATSKEKISSAIDYFKAFKIYMEQAKQAYSLAETDLDKESRDLITEYEILEQLVKQKYQDLQVDLGDIPIYQSH